MAAAAAVRRGEGCAWSSTSEPLPALAGAPFAISPSVVSEPHHGCCDKARLLPWYTRAVDYDGVIFDLDGTLVDTLKDIGDAMNRVLAREPAPAHTYEEYRYLVGRGIRNLVTEALPPKMRSDATISRCYERMLEDYGRNALVKTRPYEGVPELVRALRADGVPLAILSNKADAPTQAIVAALLDPDDFVAVIGARPGVPLKPDPSVALEVAGRLGLAPERIAYLGDSLVDMQTATAAGMIAVGAAWGFRTRAELVEHGAATVIDQPLELLGLRGRQPPVEPPPDPAPQERSRQPRT